MIECKNQYAPKITMLIPERVVKTENCENSHVLLQERERQAVLGTIKTTCDIEDKGYVLLDFGAEIQGGAMITVQDSENAKLRVTFGESVSEALSNIGENNAVNDHSPRDMIIEAKMLSNVRVGNTGFRFVKLEACGGNVKLRSVQAVFEHSGTVLRGAFECSDERINQIWKTAVRTVYLCMQEYIWDGIKRDRLVWQGDMHPEIAVVCAAFPDAECITKSLDLAKNETPSDKWINNIPSYSFQWIRCQYLWYMQNGDFEYLKNQKDYLLALIGRADSIVDSDGSIKIDDKFVDWSARHTEYEAAGLRAVMKLAMHDAEFLCKELGESEFAAICQNTSMRLAKYTEIFDGNKQITALCALAGLCSPDEAYEITSKDGARGLSTFLGYYTLLSMSAAGHTDTALDIMKEYWGAMLDFGATSFWEDFDIDWIDNAARIDEIVPEGKADLHADFGKYCYKQLRHSLCHGWAGGPAAYLAEYVLGVKIAAPGCKKVQIKPSLGNLSFAKGVYPTPYGDINISHENIGGEIITKVSAPKEVSVEILK